MKTGAGLSGPARAGHFSPGPRHPRRQSPAPDVPRARPSIPRAGAPFRMVLRKASSWVGRIPDGPFRRPSQSPGPGTRHGCPSVPRGSAGSERTIHPRVATSSKAAAIRFSMPWRCQSRSTASFERYSDWPWIFPNPKPTRCASEKARTRSSFCDFTLRLSAVIPCSHEGASIRPFMSAKARCNRARSPS